MISQLSEAVWWGDKPSVKESLGQFQSVINVAHVLRRPYWQDLGGLDWRVWYFRLASPDREMLEQSHLDGLSAVMEAIRIGGKLPVLCHCKMGGHRGPSTALFAHWHLSGRTLSALWDGAQKIDDVMHGKYLGKYHKEKDGTSPAGMYRRCVIAYCEQHSRPKERLVVR